MKKVKKKQRIATGCFSLCVSQCTKARLESNICTRAEQELQKTPLSCNNVLVFLFRIQFNYRYCCMPTFHQLQLQLIIIIIVCMCSVGHTLMKNSMKAINRIECQVYLYIWRTLGALCATRGKVLRWWMSLSGLDPEPVHSPFQLVLNRCPFYYRSAECPWHCGRPRPMSLSRNRYVYCIISHRLVYT